MQNGLKYIEILNNICKYYGIDEENSIELLKIEIINIYYYYY